MIKKILLISLFLLLYTNESKTNDNQLPIVVIIPSYNNESYCEKNLESVFTQDYDNYLVIYIDDCSTDKTGDLVRKTIERYNVHDKIRFITSKERKYALENLYNAIYSCPDKTIIVTLDGDDWFAHTTVLQRLNQEYLDSNVWMTYGQYLFYPNGKIGSCANMPKKAIENNTVREYAGLASHLRTFYAWLFKAIQLKDLLYNDHFYDVTFDRAFMAPMLEMARKDHFRFIPDILYIYNHENTINVDKVHGKHQKEMWFHIRNLERYRALEQPIINQCEVMDVFFSRMNYPAAS